MAYFGAHNHTAMGSNQRLRDSINKIPDMLLYANEIGLSGIAITDHESVSASLESIKYVNEFKKQGKLPDSFKLANGNEIYLCTEDVTAENKKTNSYSHFILIALNAKGHRFIRELSTLAWTENSFHSVMMRVPTYYSQLKEAMKSSYKGDVVASSACISGALPKRILLYQETQDPEIWQSCVDWIEMMNDIFGVGYFFLELQPSHNTDQIYINQKLIELSEQTGTPYIITTDSHYLKASDAEVHEIFLKSQDGERETAEFYSTTYLMSEAEVHSYMDDYIGAEAVNLGLNNTMLIYDKVESYELTKPLEIPYLPLDASEPNEALYNKYKDKIELLSEFRHSEHDSNRHLVREIVKYIDTDPYYTTSEAFEKINECLSYIKQSSEVNGVQWARYLLQIADYVRIAWDAGSLVGIGRGSGVGFCLLNILGITQINPMREKTQLFPWRFMNPSRMSVLDIDIDICGSKRDIVIEAMRGVYGKDRVCKVMTLNTEGTRSAIQTAARGLGVDNDVAQYISSLIVADRGQLRTLSQMYYGDEDNKPVREFISEVDKHPKLFEVAQKIEGLVNGVGSHAGGVIVTDKPFSDSTALMRTNSGDIITQFDLHMAEEVSLIKVDLLCIDALDKIQSTLTLLLEDGLIEWQGSLKATYEKYLGTYVLERDSIDMWQMLWAHKIISFFQMEKESGKQAVALAKPKSVDELASINTVMRLMSQQGDEKQPLEIYTEQSRDLKIWEQRMVEYGLTSNEREWLHSQLDLSYGICATQESMMILLQHPQVGGHSLTFADKCRKSVAKKQPKAYLECQEEYYRVAREKGLSQKLIHYVWNVLIAMQRGYSFPSSHALAYSVIGLQELNLCYHFDPIYWATANLIVDASTTEGNDSGTNYDKMSVALANIQKEGIKIQLPLINSAQFGFKPNVADNSIIYGLKGINGVGDDLAQQIIANRPYRTMEDFCDKLLNTKIVTTSKMIQLIKAGCFTELHSPDRTETMEWFIRNHIFIPTEKLTMQQFNKIKELGLIPESLTLATRMINFKKYVLSDEGLVEKHIDPDKKIPKKGYHDGYYILDKKSQPFFAEHFTEDSVVKVQGDYYVVSEKLFTKEVDSKIQLIKDWFNSKEALNAYNEAVYNTLWDKYASGTLPTWSMKALSYYDGEHELEHVDEETYGIVNFFDLPEVPEVYSSYTRYINGEARQFPKYKILRIAGTILSADNLHSTITLLTKYGAVLVKFSKGQYAFYNKQISEIGEDGKKTVLDGSWLKRGNKIVCCGIRQGDNFILKKYADTVYKHTIGLINDISSDGELQISYNREEAK